MRRLAAIISTFISLLLALGLKPVESAVTLDLNLTAPSNLEVFFLEDLNISGNAPSAVVFQATVSSDLFVPDAFFIFTMRNAQSEILRGESNSFFLKPATLQITNLDLTTDGSPYKLDDYDIGSDAEYIEQKLLETGYFPSDTYFLRLELYSATNGDSLLASDELNVLLTNPFDIRLISPMGTPASPTTINTTTPLFTWSSSANQFLLKICEKGAEGLDPESVMQSNPHYETNPADPLIGQSFSYPASGIPPLEPGRTYYWQVTSLVQTSGGMTEYPSQIGAFTLFQQVDPDAQRILSSLQWILGSNYQDVMGQLSGFQPNGDIHLDGSSLTIDEFEEVADYFLKGQYKMTAVSTE